VKINTKRIFLWTTGIIGLAIGLYGIYIFIDYAMLAWMMTSGFCSYYKIPCYALIIVYLLGNILIVWSILKIKTMLTVLKIAVFYVLAWFFIGGMKYIFLMLIAPN
jgi:hypothetical protein